MRRVIAFVVGLAALFVAAGECAAERRVALVLGNDDYRIPGVPKLANASNDAQAVEQALRDLGFETILKMNATRRETNQAINDFGGKLAGGAVGLFYYAGHGIQANGHNYIIPVDSQLDTEADLDSEAVDIQKVLRVMDDARNSMNIVILDACRDNPLPRSRSAARGLARLEAPQGTFIAYSAGPGQTAQDGPPGGNGVYTGILVKTLKEPGLKLEEVFKKVTQGVKSATNNQQTPWTEASIEVDFYFHPGDGTAGAKITVTPATAPPPATTDKTVEVAFWESIKASTNPQDFHAYLRKYPGGDFAPLARIRIEALKTQQVAAVVPPPPAPAPKQAPPAEVFGSLEEVTKRASAAYTDKNYGEAVHWYRFAAERGFARAQTDLGILYANGNGVARDYTEAMAWFQKAAAQQDARALLEIGVLHETGRGVKEDERQALTWYRRAADQGSADALYKVGSFYQNGRGGLGRDYAQALDWYGKAAKAGSRDAAAAIGVLSLNGWGVTRDYAQALRWFRQAADQGDAVAQVNVAYLYDRGLGVAKNPTEARAWMQKAAATGNLEARNWLAAH